MRRLFAGLLVTIPLLLVINYLSHLTAPNLVITLGGGIASTFLLFEVDQIINGYKKYYVTATYNIYLSLYSIFIGLLYLVGIFAGK